MDCFKPSWIEEVFGEKDTASLYKCSRFGNDENVSNYYVNACNNDDKNITDKSEWNQFVKNIEDAKSISDFEAFFDVDLFITAIALEYLVGSWDHFINGGNNIYLYKATNGQWKFLIYDFDSEFGQDILYMDNFVNIAEEVSQFNQTIADAPQNVEYDLFMGNANDEKEFIPQPYKSFAEYALHGYLLDNLIFNNQERFKEKLGEIVTKIFNPTILFPYIDELKSFIDPYIKLEKTLNDQGYYPGKFDNKDNIYTYEQWNQNCDFTPVKNVLETKNGSYGIKYWILAKYRYLCRSLNLSCDTNYVSNNITKEFDNPISDIFNDSDSEENVVDVEDVDIMENNEDSADEVTAISDNYI